MQDVLHLNVIAVGSCVRLIPYLLPMEKHCTGFHCHRNGQLENQDKKNKRRKFIVKIVS